MVMPLAQNGPQNAQASAATTDDRLPGVVVGRPIVAPVLPQTPGLIAVMCPAEDVAYAEKDLVNPLVQAGFQIRLEPLPAGRTPEMPDPSCRLVLLDVSPKDPRSYIVCAELHDHLDLPLMLILRGATTDDLLRGYEAGADSCLLAPFDVREFLARLAALLRRPPPRPRTARSTE